MRMVSAASRVRASELTAHPKSSGLGHISPPPDTAGHREGYHDKLMKVLVRGLASNLVVRVDTGAESDAGLGEVTRQRTRKVEDGPGGEDGEGEPRRTIYRRLLEANDDVEGDVRHWLFECLLCELTAQDIYRPDVAMCAGYDAPLYAVYTRVSPLCPAP
jgi:hypothetical protein